jgi:hypothetical protein
VVTGVYESHRNIHGSWIYIGYAKSPSAPVESSILVFHMEVIMTVWELRAFVVDVK